MADLGATTKILCWVCWLWHEGRVLSSSWIRAGPGIPIRSFVVISIDWEVSPSSQRGGEYVFHQKTVAAGVVVVMSAGFTMA